MDTIINTNKYHRQFSTISTLTLAGALSLSIGVSPAIANDSGRPICNQTAGLLFNACITDLNEEFSLARANCLNESETATERRECTNEANEERDEGREECREIRTARRDLCSLIGQERYAPDFDPINFDPDFASPNPFYPLNVGNRWVYEAEDEMVVVEVLDRTKLIEGVTCRVVNDVVSTSEGDLVEDTDDWFAQAKVDGSIWYCGEEVSDFEFFDGDSPRLPELVSIDGAFKAGRDGAQPGILLKGNPQVGDAHRQEALYDEAEDAAVVLSISYSYGTNPALDEFVPQELAEALCNNDCLVTREFSPLEPDASERKYYAPGIGQFLEVDTESGDIAKLVECTVDSVPCTLPDDG